MTKRNHPAIYAGLTIGLLMGNMAPCMAIAKDDAKIVESVSTSKDTKTTSKDTKTTGTSKSTTTTKNADTPKSDKDDKDSKKETLTADTGKVDEKDEKTSDDEKKSEDTVETKSSTQTADTSKVNDDDKKETSSESEVTLQPASEKTESEDKTSESEKETKTEETDKSTADTSSDTSGKTTTPDTSTDKKTDTSTDSETSQNTSAYSIGNHDFSEYNAFTVDETREQLKTIGFDEAIVKSAANKDGAWIEFQSSDYSSPQKYEYRYAEYETEDGTKAKIHFIGDQWFLFAEIKLDESETFELKVSSIDDITIDPSHLKDASKPVHIEELTYDDKDIPEEQDDISALKALLEQLIENSKKSDEKNAKQAEQFQNETKELIDQLDKKIAELNKKTEDIKDKTDVINNNTSNNNNTNTNTNNSGTNTNNNGTNTNNSGTSTNTTTNNTTTWRVTFQSNGGTAVSDQVVKNGEKATKPNNPTKTNYTFAGWYTDSQLTKEYNFSTAVTNNLTLYAKWTTNASQNKTSTSTTGKESLPKTGANIAGAVTLIGAGAAGVYFGVQNYKKSKNSDENDDASIK